MSSHNAPYATTSKPKFSIGLDVYSKTLCRHVTIYGVRALKSTNGVINFYYSFSPFSSDEELWYSEHSIFPVKPYVRDRFGYCIFLGDSVLDVDGTTGCWFVVTKIDSCSSCCFLKRFLTSRYGYWAKASSLDKFCFSI